MPQVQVPHVGLLKGQEMTRPPLDFVQEGGATYFTTYIDGLNTDTTRDLLYDLHR